MIFIDGCQRWSFLAFQLRAHVQPEFIFRREPLIEFSMRSARVHHLVAMHPAFWCLAWVLFAALQPFLAVHFCQDGWEDEPGFRIRNVSASAQFEPDDRADHSNELETTVFVPAAANIDHPDTFQHGLDGLMALVFLLLPLTVALCLFAVPGGKDVRVDRPPPSGASPPVTIWLRQPPKTAPPLAT